MTITYLSPGTTDTRQVVFAVNQALERLQNLNVGSGGLETSSIVGTTTNDNATAGNIGEFQSAALSSGIALSSTVSADIITLPLTPGDWDLDGALGFTTTSTGVISWLICSISTAVNSLNGTPFQLSVQYYPPFTFPVGLSTPTIQCGPYRASIATSTTYHLVGNSEFSGTLNAYGTMRARRIR